MYAMIHSAEIVHHQQAAELARNLEWARIRSERTQEPPALAHVGGRRSLRGVVPPEPPHGGHRTLGRIGSLMASAALSRADAACHYERMGGRAAAVMIGRVPERDLHC